MTIAIARDLINKKNAIKTQKQKVAEITAVLNKYGISKSKLRNQYNQVHHKNQIPYVTFYYKFTNLTFTEVELENLKNMVDAIDNEVKFSLTK